MFVRLFYESSIYKKKKEMIIFIFLFNFLNKTFSQTLSNLSELEYLLITPSLSLLQNTKKIKDKTTLDLKVRSKNKNNV